MKPGLLLIAPLVILAASAHAIAQSVVADSVFDAELMKILVQQSQRVGTHSFPSLTISAQYSRHRPFDDQPVYQRGPYGLTEQMFRSTYKYHLAMNVEPRASTDVSPDSKRTHAAALLAPSVPLRTVTVAPTPTPWYVCGMLVSAPQVGETPASTQVGGEYLVRVAAVPVHYANDTLWLLTLLQRVVVESSESHGAPHMSSVVYKKLVDLRAGEPLSLQFPASDPSDETVEEITLVHETPQGYGLAQNVPDPVSTRTVFAYALPSQSRAQLTILKPDGTPVDTLVRGISEAGVYRAIWDAGATPPGAYHCAIEATPTAGGTSYLKQVAFTLVSSQNAHTAVPGSIDSVTEMFPVATIPLEQQRSERIFRLMVEGGAAYLAPRKSSSPFDNMFSHVAIGFGIALNKTFEAGVLFGQDGFHYERENVNPLIIPSTDEVVGTRIVAWAGGYGRIHFSAGITSGFLHASFASASGGMVSTLGLGFSMSISGGLSLYLLPHRTDQWYVHPSTKWGADYGIVFLF